MMTSTEPSLRQVLREATRADHERVDAAFAGYDLGSRTGYAAFLFAHALVLPPLERALAERPLWSGWRPRAPLLTDDLTALGIAMPGVDPESGFDTPTCWGMLYVLEGSRLGGGMLATRVPAGLPVSYLSAKHEGGSWRRFGLALDAAGAETGRAWRDAAVAGAHATFARFERAAATTPEPGLA